MGWWRGGRKLVLKQEDKHRPIEFFQEPSSSPRDAGTRARLLKREGIYRAFAARKASEKVSDIVSSGQEDLRAMTTSSKSPAATSPADEALLRERIRDTLSASRSWLDADDEAGQAQLIDLVTLAHKGAISLSEYQKALRSMHAARVRTDVYAEQARTSPAAHGSPLRGGW